MDNLPLLFFLSPESAAVGAILAVLVLACYLIYLGIHGITKKESILWSVLKILGGLLTCAMFLGSLVYYYNKNK